MSEPTPPKGPQPYTHTTPPIPDIDDEEISPSHPTDVVPVTPTQEDQTPDTVLTTRKTATTPTKPVVNAHAREVELTKKSYLRQAETVGSLETRQFLADSLETVENLLDHPEQNPEDTPFLVLHIDADGKFTRVLPPEGDPHSEEAKKLRSNLKQHVQDVKTFYTPERKETQRKELSNAKVVLDGYKQKLSELKTALPPIPQETTGISMNLKELGKVPTPIPVPIPTKPTVPVPAPIKPGFTFTKTHHEKEKEVPTTPVKEEKPPLMTFPEDETELEIPTEPPAVPVSPTPRPAGPVPKPTPSSSMDEELHKKMAETEKEIRSKNHNDLVLDRHPRIKALHTVTRDLTAPDIDEQGDDATAFVLPPDGIEKGRQRQNRPHLARKALLFKVLMGMHRKHKLEAALVFPNQAIPAYQAALLCTKPQTHPVMYGLGTEEAKLASQKNLINLFNLSEETASLIAEDVTGSSSVKELPNSFSGALVRDIERMEEMRFQEQFDISLLESYQMLMERCTTPQEESQVKGEIALLCLRWRALLEAQYELDEKCELTIKGHVMERTKGAYEARSDEEERKRYEESETPFSQQKYLMMKLGTLTNHYHYSPPES